MAVRFPHVHSHYEKGDQLIQVNVWTPQHVSEEEKSILERLSTSPNMVPNPEKTEKGFFDKIKDLFS